MPGPSDNLPVSLIFIKMKFFSRDLAPIKEYSQVVYSCFKSALKPSDGSSSVKVLLKSKRISFQSINCFNLGKINFR